MASPMDAIAPGPLSPRTTTFRSLRPGRRRARFQTAGSERDEARGPRRSDHVESREETSMDSAMLRRINRRRMMQGSAGLLGIAAAGGGRGIGRVHAQAEVSGEIEFAYYNWGPESIDFFKQMAAAFEASHPDTKINLSLPPFEQYDQTLSVLLATGNGPDIITTAGATQALFQEGRLLDLTDRVSADPILTDPNAFIQSGWDVYKFGTDRIYGMYSGADT